MRERVAVYDGDLTVGAGAGGGFRVHATFAVRTRGGIVIRVVVADDQALVRSGFALILGVRADIEVVAEVADGAQASRPRASSHLTWS